MPGRAAGRSGLRTPAGGGRDDRHPGCRGNEVATATTGVDGRYEVALPPGRYTVEGLPVEGLMGNPAPVDVEVGDGDVTVELSYDTGIR